MINEEKLKLQKEAIQALRDNNFNGIVILPTGTGKSFVLIESLKEIYKPGMNVLYTCDSIRLRDIDFNKELIKWGADNYIDKIEKQCYASAYKKEGEQYDIGLFDEGDYALTPEYSKLFTNNKFNHIIFVSATLDSSKKKYADLIAPVVYKKNIKDIEEQKVVNKCQFIIVPYLLNKYENKKYLEFNKSFRNYLVQDQTHVIKKRLEFLKIERQHFLAKLESSSYICKKLIQRIKENEPDSKTLIFCGLKEQADKISEYSYYTGNEANNNLEKFDKGEIKELVVCGKVNRGINLSGVNNIINENCKQSKTLMIQRTGRGRRLDINDILNIYVPIPYFKPDFGEIKPTIIMN
jgi:superfamily II DNA or RNA helicase